MLSALSTTRRSGRGTAVRGALLFLMISTLGACGDGNDDGGSTGGATTSGSTTGTTDGVTTGDTGVGTGTTDGTVDGSTGGGTGTLDGGTTGSGSTDGTSEGTTGGDTGTTSGDTGMLGDDPLARDNFTFGVEPGFAESFPSIAQFVTNVFSASIQPLNVVDNLFDGVTVPVVYGSCDGVANAFYVPAERLVVLCNELLAFNLQVFDQLLSASDSEQDSDLAFEFAVDALVFTLFHELGHALDDLTGVNIPGNFESAADAIATVISVESEQPIASLAGAFFFGAVDSGNSFLDVHGSGQDRAGDIFCWTFGGSPESSAVLATLAQSLIEAGRDCVGEYANQHAFVDQIIPGFVRQLPAAKRPKLDHALIEAARAEMDLR